MWTGVIRTLALLAAFNLTLSLMSGVGYGHWHRAAVQAAPLPLVLGGLIFAVFRRRSTSR